MAKYSFKYWFEWGCFENHCPCLWDSNGLVSLDVLPISLELKRFLCELGIEHDNALDWDCPSNPLLWSKEEKEALYKKAKEGYHRLQEELGEEYEIIYCEDE